MSLSGDSRSDLAAWDAVAATYADLTTGEDSISARFRSFLSEELGELAGKKVLDLGCGPGWLSARLAAEGASVSAVDGSAALLAIARTNHPGLDIHQADLSQGLGTVAAAGPFDRVVALMVLMDIPALDRLLADVAACLAPDGRFIFTMPHPCFWAQSPVEDPASGERYRKVRGYLAQEERWVESFGGHRHYHRPLSWYVDQLSEAGLVLTRLVEPPTPPGDMRPPEQWSTYETWMASIPTMIGISTARRDA